MEFSESLDTLALVAITIWGAFLIGQICRQLGIPQVVGFIVGGTLLGTSVLNVVPQELNNNLLFISEIALALIGFDMGEHLRFSELRKLGRTIILIVTFEAFGAFLVVAAGVALLTHELATGLVFGAIASATAPAATVDVLAEYGAEGPMTTTLLAVVGIDDAISLMLFSLTSAVIGPLLSAGESLRDIAPLDIIEPPLTEIGLSLVVGVLAGLFITRWMNYIHHNHEPSRRQHDAMAVSIAAVLLVAGLSHTLEMSLILSAMTMGVTVVNLAPEQGRYIRFTIEQAGPVIYVLFFALVGARFNIKALPEMGVLGLLYIALRSAGKYVGVWFGGTLARASDAIRYNLGLGLLSQAGVAIGLALECSCHFAEFGPKGEELGTLIITVITATTFVVQLIGPVMVKVAITRAGEIGKAFNAYESVP